VPSRCRLREPDPAARVLFSPSPYPYSPECVEELFSEVELPLDGVLRSSIARTLPLCRERGPFGKGILHLHQERPEEEAIDG
jgi:hypothetical protein